MPPRIPTLIGILAICLLQITHSKSPHRSARLPLPTSETLPYVAEVMGATSYEETVEDGPATSSVKRVQRKLTDPEHKTPDLDQEDYKEYQGVIGRPGVDFPVLPTIPRTEFSCRNVKSSGYYADLQTGCQVFHICDGGRKISFLCPNGTIFRQSHLICDWWFRVDCERSIEQYEESAELLAHDQMIYKKRAEEMAKAMATKSAPAPKMDQPKPVLQDRQLKRKPRPEQEQERQIPAETASFTSNRHRFNNQIDNIGSDQSATRSTTAFPVRQTSENGFNNGQQFQSTKSFSDYSSSSYEASSSQRVDNYPSAQVTVQNGKQLQRDIGLVQGNPSSVTPVANIRQTGNYNGHTMNPQNSGKTQQYDQKNYASQRPPTKQKVTFNAKGKAEKDFPYFDSQKEGVTTVFPPSFGTKSSQYLSKSGVEISTTSLPSTVSNSKTYLPNSQLTGNYYETTHPPNKYASIDISGTTVEIRPEIVNSMLEKGVTPTSAKALHSLASYIGSGEAEEFTGDAYRSSDQRPHVSDVLLNLNSVNTATPTSSADTTTTIALTASGEDLPSVLTKSTKDSYSYLFSENKEDKKEGKPSLLETDYTNQKPKTMSLELSSSLQSKYERFKDSSELRELAQVFSRALSAYLEDPETFKEILAQVRPTEPNVENTTPSLEDEVLDFSDANQEHFGGTTDTSTNKNYAFTDDIGEINSLANSVKTVEPDNSLTHHTYPPTAPEAASPYLSPVSPSLIAVDVLALNKSKPSLRQNVDYYSKLGSNEDPSYFPTVGGVSDATRPRYGGFQNNSQTSGKYSPYGAGLPKNVTGPPLYNVSPTLPTSKNYNTTSSTNSIPEPIDVNGLMGQNNGLSSDQAVSSEDTRPADQSKHFSFSSLDQEQEFYPSRDQEKLLLASGSQSLVASKNYLEFSKKAASESATSEENSSKYYDPANNYRTDDYFPYFGQEPPLEILAQPSGFQVQSNQEQRRVKVQSGRNSDPVNYHIGDYDRSATSAAPSSVRTDRGGSYKDINLGNGEILEKDGFSTVKDPYETSWTASPSYNLVTSVSADNSLMSQDKQYTQYPESQYTEKFHPTTYHPFHATETDGIFDLKWETTPQPEYGAYTYTQVATTPAPTTIEDFNGDQLTTLPSNGNFEETAKKMFGMLNETAAGTLMNMMTQAESNITIRKLILLLVNDKGRANKTAEESRQSLINALLDKMKEADKSETSVYTTASTTAYSPSTYLPRKKVRVSRVRSSELASRGKVYRTVDSMTGNHGSNQGSPQLTNQLNAAKLYIPSVQSTTSSPPTTNNRLPLDSDARAVELLKTLYSLAAKWG